MVWFFHSRVSSSGRKISKLTYSLISHFSFFTYSSLATYESKMFCILNFDIVILYLFQSFSMYIISNIEVLYFIRFLLITFSRQSNFNFLYRTIYFIFKNTIQSIHFVLFFNICITKNTQNHCLRTTNSNFISELHFYNRTILYRRLEAHRRIFERGKIQIQ